MQWFSKMTVGQTAPDISTTDPLKKEIKLSSIAKPYTLVVFWASWCPTCEELLPKLETWYKSKIMDMEILAISIDTTGTDWKNALAKNSYTFLHGCDLKGWNGKAAEDLCIYATPTMMILDRYRKIIAKPLSFEDFARTAGSLAK
jgi:thiol-disulfide isomerase/thioredoxin